MRLRLRAKFLIPTIFLVVVGMGASLIISYFYSAGALEASVKDQLAFMAESIDRNISDWRLERVREVKNWSGNSLLEAALKKGFVGKSARKSADVFFADLKEEYTFYEGINLADQSGTVVSGAVAEQIGVSVADRKYFQESMAGNPFFSEILKSKSSGNPVFVLSHPVKKGEEVLGVFFVIVNLSHFTREYVDSIKVGQNGYAFLFDQNGQVLAHRDQSKIMKMNMKDFDFGRKMISQAAGTISFEFEGVSKLASFKRNEATGWTVGITAGRDETLAAVEKIGVINLVLAAVVILLLSGAMIFLVELLVTRPLKKAVAVADSISNGDLSRRIESRSTDETGELAAALNRMADSLEDKADLAGKIADGDLSMEAVLASDKDALGLALKRMIEELNEVLSMVHEAVNQVAAGSSEISDSSQSLSQGASEQAASLEEITSSMTQVGAQTKTNAENATQANQLAMAARGSAENGNTRMQEMIAAMGEINQSSDEIAKIIKTIDDIAFQTNLLALNAAVEAARAGKHGKGFAVVAQEVRNLAARSAKAARETAELIDGSVKKVERGTEIVNSTAEALSEIVSGSAKVTDLVGEIASASNEQAAGVSEINQGLSQVEQVTQQNTSNAEETASAAEELAAQAEELRRVLSRFQLKKAEADFSGAEAGPSSPPVLGGEKPESTHQEGWAGDDSGKKADRKLKPSDLIALDDDEFGKY